MLSPIERLYSGCLCRFAPVFSVAVSGLSDVGQSLALSEHLQTTSCPTLRLCPGMEQNFVFSTTLSPET